MLSRSTVKDVNMMAIGDAIFTKRHLYCGLIVTIDHAVVIAWAAREIRLARSGSPFVHLD